jgi:putative hydrolase of the HAD superfamily
MITTVVFDLDDTLYDEIDYCRSGFAAVAQFITDLPNAPCRQTIFEALWRQFTTGNHTQTFNAALEQLGIAYDYEYVRRLVGVYRNHVPKISLPADSLEVLAQLRGQFTLGLLTDGFLPAQELKVQALRIEAYFECIIYTERLGRQFWKPSPAGFEKLLETLNTGPQSAVYVADNETKDFIAPNKLGFVTIQLTRPARIHTESGSGPFAAAKHKIHKIGLLPALLAEL